MERAGVAFEESEREQWSFAPFLSVGPLRFGMSRDEVVAALGNELPGVEVPGEWAMFHLPSSRGHAVTTYFAASGTLASVAIDALRGPQVALGDLRLVGQVPSKLADQFADYVSGQGLDGAIRCSQYGDLGADALGVVLRAQRAGDILLSRPVFVAREWADRVCDAWEGHVPQEEWRVYC
ncbi:hypothetical protein ABZ490_38940 [Streptomyces sp. NPDC005811]|uniref:hypothetical protein n=1 Tax=Streptomyces sp. NPDC005811 TaxID=3154565 RepID=UPI0033CDAFBF